MAHDKDFLDDKEHDEPYAADSAPRARNRTVMLTPDITDQVRARLAKEMDAPPQVAPGRPAAPQPAPRVPGASGAFTSTYTPAGTPQPMMAPPPPTQPMYVPPHHAAPAPAPQRSAVVPTAGAVWSSVSPIIGFLVSFDSNKNGDVYELRTGRLIITNEPAASGNYIALTDASVSPMHAIMRISATGEIQVLDQLSEFGTKIVRFGSNAEEELSGDKSSVEHGDVLKFGERAFHVCVLAKGGQEA